MHYAQMLTKGKIFKSNKNDSNEIIIKEDVAEVVLYDMHHVEKARTIIDAEDVNKIKNMKWNYSGHGYVYSGSGKNKKILHRYLLSASTGMDVDHVNHNTLDNRKINLRICTRSENNYNKKISKNNTTGVKGLSWNNSRKKYEACIWANKKKIYLGRFDNKEEAICVLKLAREKYHGDFAFSG